MPKLRQISSHDSSAFTEIIEVASPIITEVARAKAKDGYTFLLDSIEHGELGSKGHCVAASDAVTRAAHSLGIVASREWHGDHFITSFNALEAVARDDDPILCMTWGQFDTPLGASTPRQASYQPYFGRRRDMIDLLPNGYDHFSPYTVSERHVIHRPATEYPVAHEWLMTTPIEVIMGDFTISEVAETDYPLHQWSE